MLTSLLALIFSFLASLGLQVGTPARITPCATPLEYSIGSFDRRFGVRYEEFLSALSEAEGVWEKALQAEGVPGDKQLFNYSPTDGPLVINLVYDYRQKATKDLSSIENTLDKGNAQYRELESVYHSLTDRYETLKASYDADSSTWETHRRTYEAQVERWNAGPRTSEADFKALQAARTSLEAETATLKATETRLNSLAQDANALGSQLNALAKELNLGVLQYNEVGKTRGETFTGGLYTSDEEGERVDIFEFENHTELVHLLAHELGHALGLEHVDDPKAIMYYLDQTPSTNPTPGDVAALKELCGVQ